MALRFRNEKYVPDSILIGELSDFVKDNVNGSPLIVKLKDRFGFGYLSVERLRHNGLHFLRELYLPNDFGYEDIKKSRLYNDIFFNANNGIYLNVRKNNGKYRVRVYS